ncbi:MAG: Glutathione-regulated potassium-efflux system protein KefB [uncultured Sulfurovum sp.]|uniref:Glutathione-regulated potassium-efflux system protein KefB n=1 Tax=uncultured Sulfurovum sp. TaxID=269237 RepID=A0A6S6T0H6_9BACT|nr:MAG: Glutathione-regulated potassium-efflux system protein KefB [uncultured Sulfurovum sp.]
MLLIIVSTLFISLLINIFLKKINLPTIIGYIITGTSISYLFGLHEAVNNHTLKEIAEFGIVFLMFTIGLEFSLKHLKEMRYEVFLVGSLQIIATAIIAFLVTFYLFSLDLNSALIIALALAMSSTAIVLKTFNETGEINKRYGKNALGILIMQDIAVIPILIFIGILGSKESNISSIILQTSVSVLILFVILFVLAKYLLEPFLTQIIKTRSDELFMSSILFLAIGASYLAYVVGFSYSLGAFAAGMLISETKYKHQAEAELIPFRDLLLGVFFITVGMQIKFDIVFSYAPIILLLLLLIILVKFAIIYFFVRKKDDKRTTLKTALTLVQVGEFALVILELARVNSLIVSPYGQIMIVTIILSMVLTPFILRNLSVITDFFMKLDDAKSEQEFLTAPIEGHVVVLGYGEFGQNVVSKLKNDGEFYIIVENNIDRYTIAKNHHESVIFGQAENKRILQKTYITRAKKVIVAIDNPKKLYHLCNELQKIVHASKIVVKVHALRERQALLDLGISNIIVENEESSKAMLEYV